MRKLWEPYRHLSTPPPPWLEMDIIVNANWLTVSKKNVSDAELRQLFYYELSTMNSAATIIYTDGSVREDCGVAGAGFCIPTRVVERQHLVDQGHPISSVELFAINQAVRFAQASHLGDIIICSDSKTALTILVHVPEDPQALIFRSLYDGYQGQISLVWCPAHVGVEGNELADRCADVASSHRPHLATDFLPSTKKSLKARSAEYVRGLWLSAWTEAVASRDRGFYKPVPDRDPVGCLGLPRWKDSLVARLNCDRLPTNARLHSVHLKPSPLCTNCIANEVQTVEHILFDCSHARDKRAHLLRSLTDTAHSHNLDGVKRAIQSGAIVVVTYVCDILRAAKLR